MRIDSLIIRNFRCIGEMKLDRFLPVTVLVGRNNTGKSAFIEALALASTANAGWYDAIGGDLLDQIVEARGGYEYAQLMIKIGTQEAEILPEGENITGSLQIVRNLEDLHESARPLLFNSVFNYTRDVYERKAARLPYRSARSKEGRPPISTSDLERKARLAEREAVRLFKACLIYNTKQKEKLQTAAIFGETSSESDLDDFIPFDEILRSSSPKESKTVFPVFPDFEYIQELQRGLTKSGELVGLISSIREHVPYFQDIREVEDDLLVFITGLEKPVPLQSMGEGFVAQLALLAAITAAKGGLILIEEPENNLHPGYMSIVANQIIKTAHQKKTQFVLSTHSLDFLQFLLEASPELIRVVRMYRIDDRAETDYEVLSGNEALEEIKDLKMDLRGV